MAGIYTHTHIALLWSARQNHNRLPGDASTKQICGVEHLAGEPAAAFISAIRAARTISPAANKETEPSAAAQPNSHEQQG
jgi:hypothetical protein